MRVITRHGFTHTSELLIVLMLASLAGSVGCTIDTTDGGIGFGGPMILPPTLRLGDSAIMVIWNSQDDLTPGVTFDEKFDLSTDNVTIELSRYGYAEVVTPRAVIELPLWAGAIYSRLFGGGFGQLMTIALFDTPTEWDNYTSGDGDIVIDAKPMFGGVSYGYSRSFTVIDDGGGPLLFGKESAPFQLSSEPMYRLAPVWDASEAFGVDPTWNISAIQFTLNYDDLDLSNPQVHVGGAATGAIAVVGAVEPGGLGASIKIALIHPGAQGFRPYTANRTECTLAGGLDCVSVAPIFDITFDKDSSGYNYRDPVFDDTMFSIDDIEFFDPDGTLLSGSSLTEAEEELFFSSWVVRNLAEGEDADGDGFYSNVLVSEGGDNCPDTWNEAQLNDDPLGEENDIGNACECYPLVLYKWYSPQLFDHKITTSSYRPVYYGLPYQADTANGGQIVGSMCTQQAAGTVPVYSYFDATKYDSYYSTVWQPIGVNPDFKGVFGYVYDVDPGGGVPLQEYFSDAGTYDDHYVNPTNPGAPFVDLLTTIGYVDP
ncbi:MAG: hypothetical protein ACI8W3_002371 [Myxococcota bacterium]|jgi:hypothetical protein